jgi:hypothetical protein
MTPEDARRIRYEANSVSEDNYRALVNSAVRAGIIDTALPFEAESSIVERMNNE